MSRFEFTEEVQEKLRRPAANEIDGPGFLWECHVYNKDHQSWMPRVCECDGYYWHPAPSSCTDHIRRYRHEKLSLPVKEAFEQEHPTYKGQELHLWMYFWVVKRDNKPFDPAKGKFPCTLYIERSARTDHNQPVDRIS